jgi:hypothetical protein
MVWRVMNSKDSNDGIRNCGWNKKKGNERALAMKKSS